MQINEIQPIELQIHYYLNKDGWHQMDAKTHNECERQFLKALDALKMYIGDFDVDVVPKREGGVVDTLIIAFKTVLGYDIVKSFLEAFIQRWFSSEQTKLEAIDKRIDILQRIKDGNMSQGEVMYLVDKDKPLRNCLSEYYKNLNKELTVTKVSAEALYKLESKPFATAEIIKADFEKQIVEENISEESTEICGTTINILSPVLQKGHGSKWRGIYSGSSIEFRIVDEMFLQQVYANEIKFGANTVIKCTLVILHKYAYSEDGEVTEKEPTYTVKDVTQWSDDETFQYETKRYRKKKADKMQLELFPDQDMNGE